MLLCMANIGSSMANLFRFLYAKVCCGYCNYIKRRNLRMKTAAHANVVSFAALTTTNLIVNSNGQNISEKLQYISSTNPNSQFQTDNKTHSEESAQSKKAYLALTQEQKLEELKHANGKGLLKAEPDIIDLLEEANYTDYKKITVPISLSLLILSSYVLFGGIIFKTLEGWSILDGVYFCFITLSTIGLGDLVPGNSINDSDAQAEFKLAGVALYVLIGLSLIAMCFNLMQEEVIAKFRKIAVRLGIIDDPNYW